MRYFPKRNDASASFRALSSDGFGSGHHIVAVGADVELRPFLLELEDGLQSTRPFAHSSGQLSLSIIKSKQGLGWVDLICRNNRRMDKADSNLPCEQIRPFIEVTDVLLTDGLIATATGAA